MNDKERLVKIIEVILTNLLTYLVLAQTGLTWLVTSDILSGYPQVLGYVIVVLNVLGVVTIFIRRVTPVEESERGLLPVEGGEYDNS